MIFTEPTLLQADLRASAIGLIDETMPLTRVRALAEAGGTIDIEQRRAVAGLGWFSLLGTDGVSFRERFLAAATVAETRGAHLQPGTFIAANLLAFNIVENAPPAAELLAVAAGVTRGDTAVAWVCATECGHWGTDVVVTDTADVRRLSGTSGVVQDAHQVEWLLVRARTGDTIDTILVATDAPGITITRLDGLDLTRSWSRVRFDAVAFESWARVSSGGHATITDRQLQIAATLSMCETVGAIERLFTMTLQYAKDRVAFGRPIGSFQAMKHLLADASVSLETSAAMAEAAATAVADERPDVAQIVSMAKSYIGDASLDVVNACWQTHGGIAYTWNHDFHLYLRRVSADASMYGDATWHREQLCRINGL